MSTLPPLARVPLLVLGLLSLLTGVFAGLARLGVEVPALAAVHAGNHAALMICAFFGTVICLERAVALGGLWPYAGPAAAGAGGVLLLAGGPLLAAQFLFLIAAATLSNRYISDRFLPDKAIDLVDEAAACMLI